jgi:hypothetical protein
MVTELEVRCQREIVLSKEIVRLSVAQVSHYFLL